MPALHTPPTGPQTRLVRRMVGTRIVSVATGPGRVLCTLDGIEVDKRLLPGLVDRGYVRERQVDAGTSEYTLTAAGLLWAAEGV